MRGQGVPAASIETLATTPHKAASEANPNEP